MKRQKKDKRLADKEWRKRVGFDNIRKNIWYEPKIEEVKWATQKKIKRICPQDMKNKIYDSHEEHVKLHKEMARSMPPDFRAHYLDGVHSNFSGRRYRRGKNRCSFCGAKTRRIWP
jgi:hypothetical protein